MSLCDSGLSPSPSLSLCACVVRVTMFKWSAPCIIIVCTHSGVGARRQGVHLGRRGVTTDQSRTFSRILLHLADCSSRVAPVAAAAAAAAAAAGVVV